MRRWGKHGCIAALAATCLMMVLPSAGTAADEVPGFPFLGALPIGDQVALSHDGSTLAVGSVSANRVLVYERPVDGWGAPLDPPAELSSSEASPATFGHRVAISDDGSVIATRGYDSPRGDPLYVIQRPAGGWADGAYVGVHDGEFDGELAISGDGSTIVTGMWGGHHAFVWEREADPGIYRESELQMTPSLGLDLSRDGRFLVAVGGDSTFGSRATTVLTRPEGGWHSYPYPERTRLTLPPDGSLQAPVLDAAISDDGQTVVLGGMTGTGAIYEHGLLVSRLSGGSGHSRVALSADGALATITERSPSNTAVSRAYHRPDGGWPGYMLPTATLPGPAALAGGWYGVISGDGGTVFVGGPAELFAYARDRIAPTTRLTLVPALPGGSNGWHVRPVTTSRSAEDDATGAGVLETRCVLDPVVVPTSFAQLPAGPCGFPASHTVSATGRHSFHAASIDRLGNAGAVESVSFDLDMVAPTLRLPTALAVDAALPGGVEVRYDASAADDFAPTVPVLCTPASGTVFPLGVSTVRCEAGDQAGNRARADFDVTVRYAPLPPVPGPPEPPAPPTPAPPGPPMPEPRAPATPTRPGGEAPDDPPGEGEPARVRLSALALRGRALTVRVSGPATVRADLARCATRRRGGRAVMSCATAVTVSARARGAGVVRLALPGRLSAGRYRATVRASGDGGRAAPLVKTVTLPRR